MPALKHTAVVGGGWAGCAAAVELVRAGQRVTVFEAARTLGGRARHVQLEDKRLDNGQHILLGAYREALRLMKLVGIDADQALLRVPLQMRYPPSEDGMDFVAARLPAPFHLMVAAVKAKGLTREDKLALARFSTTARWMDWQLNTDCSVSELLERYDQTDRLIRLLWRPLCIAALTTQPEEASAQVFLNVLRDSLGARRSASDMLIPRSDLTHLFPEYAASYVEAAGSSVYHGTSIRSIRNESGFWRLAANGSDMETTHVFDHVVIATPAMQAASLLDGLTDTAAFKALQYEAITTCYLQYPSNIRLPSPFYALLDRPEAQEWAQFVFDRGHLDQGQAGLLAAVISSSHEAIGSGHDALASAIAKQLSRALQKPELECPEWTKVISEKRAGFSCTPSLPRPANETGIQGLVVAGDYTAGEYPATLEGAVRSGIQAAHLLLEDRQNQ